jgi:hypothetical protein
MLWVDKHRPLALDKLDYHKDQASQLAKLVCMRVRGLELHAPNRISIPNGHVTQLFEPFLRLCLHFMLYVMYHVETTWASHTNSSGCRLKPVIFLTCFSTARRVPERKLASWQCSALYLALVWSVCAWNIEISRPHPVVLSK